MRHIPYLPVCGHGTRENDGRARALSLTHFLCAVHMCLPASQRLFVHHDGSFNGKHNSKWVEPSRPLPHPSIGPLAQVARRSSQGSVRHNVTQLVSSPIHHNRPSTFATQPTIPPAHMRRSSLRLLCSGMQTPCAEWGWESEGIRVSVWSIGQHLG